MNSKFLLLGTLATFMTLFAWQTLSNVPTPWHEATLHEFSDNDAHAIQFLLAGLVLGVVRRKTQPATVA